MAAEDGSSHNLFIHDTRVNSQLFKKYCEWIRDRLINRADAYVLNLPNGDKYSPVDRDGDKKPKTPLTTETIVRHCLGLETISLYAIALDNTCRWVCIDVDDHTGIKAKQTIEYAFTLAARVRDLGMEPLIENSDGGGGWHVWVLFCEPVLSEVAYRFGHWLVEVMCPATVGVEVFPAQECLTETSRYGLAVRVPGFHPRRQVWSQVLGDGPFYELPSEEAIEALAGHSGSAPLFIPREARGYQPENYKRRWLGGRREVPDSDEDYSSVEAVFTRRVSWEAILRPHGWEAVKAVEDVTYWRRPNKYIGGHSATTGFCGDRLHVFSGDEGCRPFVKGETYSKWHAHVLLSFGGDSDAAEGDYLFNHDSYE